MINKKNFKFALIFLSLAIVGCGPSDTGDLTGVPGRRAWYHPQPMGTVYVPTGTYHSGQSDQDIFNTYVAPNKQVSVKGFWMDETEITNNEYRQFVNWCIDSIARYLIDEDELFIVNEDGDRSGINYRRKIDWTKYKDELEEMFYDEEESFMGRKQIDTRKLKFKWMWMDLVDAANRDRDKYDPMNRKEFFRQEETLIYPDTLCWIRDFTFSYNDPQARQYFNHPKYDNYPVVGVNWFQANAFSWWRTLRKENYWDRIKEYHTEPFRLPTEFEWEYAARGGKINSKYPWGGPYTRNSKGCMLANFKPMRGNYVVDGGFYSVKADAYFPNDWGLYNMAGNVAEWTITAWDPRASLATHDLNPHLVRNIPEANSKSTDPRVQAARDIPMAMKTKVIRGGSWKDIAYFIENGSRTYEFQDTSKSYVGFRCIQTYIGRSKNDK